MVLSNQISKELLEQMQTSTGESLAAISNRQLVVLIFLRHFGCTFCREALSDISKKRSEILATGTEIVFVHMSEFKIAEKYFKRYNLDGAIHISDPECHYYQQFGLTKGNFNQLFGLQSWIRGFSAGVANMHGVGIRQIGDGFQMPGVFVIHEGQIKDSYIHKLSSDRPDYVALLNCCAV